MTTYTKLVTTITRMSRAKRLALAKQASLAILSELRRFYDRQADRYSHFFEIVGTFLLGDDKANKAEYQFYVELFPGVDMDAFAERLRGLGTKETRDRVDRLIDSFSREAKEATVSLGLCFMCEGNFDKKDKTLVEKILAD